MTPDKATLEPKWLWYLVSFLLPVVGIILGLLYRRQETPASVSFGKRTALAAILGLATCFAFYAVWFFVLGAAELF